MKKTRSKKSRDTVPLRENFAQPLRLKTQIFLSAPAEFFDRTVGQIAILNCLRAGGRGEGVRESGLHLWA